MTILLGPIPLDQFALQRMIRIDESPVHATKQQTHDSQSNLWPWSQSVADRRGEYHTARHGGVRPSARAANTAAHSKSHIAEHCPSSG